MSEIKNIANDEKKRSEFAEKEQKSKREKVYRAASAEDFMLWLLTVINREARAEISGENEITVTDAFGGVFKLEVFTGDEKSDGDCAKDVSD